MSRGEVVSNPSVLEKVYGQKIYYIVGHILFDVTQHHVLRSWDSVTPLGKNK